MRSKLGHNYGAAGGSVLPGRSGTVAVNHLAELIAQADVRDSLGLLRVLHTDPVNGRQVLRVSDLPRRAALERALLALQETGATLDSLLSVPQGSGGVAPPAAMVQPSSGGFLPTQLPGLVLWLRSDTGVTLSGSNVTAWADQSGKGNNYAIASDFPTFTASDAKYGGKPSVVGGATLSLNVVGGSFSGGTVPITVLAATVGTNSSAAAILFGAAGQPQIGLDSTGHWYLGDGTNVSSSVVANTSAHALAGLFTSSAMTLYLDSSAANVATVATGSSNATSSSVLGIAGPPSVDAYTGSVAELLVYSGALTQAQISQVFRYFASKYSGTWS